MKRTAEWRLINEVSWYSLERYLGKYRRWDAIYP